MEAVSCVLLFVGRLIKKLESWRGNGTSMISLIIPPKDDVNRINRLLQVKKTQGSYLVKVVNPLSGTKQIKADSSSRRNEENDTKN